VRTELFHEDGLIDITKVKAPFRRFAKTHKLKRPVCFGG